MKKVLLASALALATVSAAIAPTEAATVVIKSGDHMHVRHHCKTTMVTHWRHHKKVVEKVRVCK